jgi:hypothetical protein
LDAIHFTNILYSIDANDKVSHHEWTTLDSSVQW